MAKAWSRVSAADAELLLAAVDAGIPSAEAASALGLTRRQAEVVRQRAGVVLGRANTVIVEEHRRRVRAAAGLVPLRPKPRTMPQAKARAQELLAQGWSDVEVAGELGLHRRTVQDWRLGVRRCGGTRIYPDGRVVDPRTGTRYLKI